MFQTQQRQVFALIKKIKEVLPSEILIKEVSALYNDDKKSVSVKLDKINLIKQEDSNISINCNSGYVLAAVSTSKTKTFGVRFNFSGNIVSEFSGSSMIISLDQYKKADVTLYKTQFLAHYRDGCVYARSTQQSLPYSIFAKYDFNNDDFTADIELNELVIPSVVKFTVNNNKVKDFLYSGVSFLGSISGNRNKKYYSWKGNGSVSIPDSIVKGGEKISFDAYGNTERIKINTLSAEGAVFEGFVTGVYDIAQRKPSGNIDIKRITLPNGNNLAGELYVESQNGIIQAFMPQLYLGDQKFTALEVTATPKNGKISFTFEIEDYSHSDYEKPAENPVLDISLKQLFS